MNKNHTFRWKNALPKCRNTALRRSCNSKFSGGGGMPQEPPRLASTCPFFLSWKAGKYVSCIKCNNSMATWAGSEYTITESYSKWLPVYWQFLMFVTHGYTAISISISYNKDISGTQNPLTQQMFLLLPLLYCIITRVINSFLPFCATSMSTSLVTFLSMGQFQSSSLNPQGSYTAVLLFKTTLEVRTPLNSEEFWAVPKFPKFDHVKTISQLWPPHHSLEDQTSQITATCDWPLWSWGTMGKMLKTWRSRSLCHVVH